MKKSRIISIILALSMLLAVLVPAIAADTEEENVIIQEPVVETVDTEEELKAEEPKAEEPEAEEPKAVEPEAEEPKAEEPEAEEPKAEEPEAEEPKAEEPKAEEPKAEEPEAIESEAEGSALEKAESKTRKLVAGTALYGDKELTEVVGTLSEDALVILNETEGKAASIRYATVVDDAKEVLVAWVAIEDLKDAGDADLKEEELKTVVFIVVEETEEPVETPAEEPITEEAETIVTVEEAAEETAETSDATETGGEKAEEATIPVFETEGDILVKYNGEDEIVRIPDGIKEIGKKAFADNKKIRKVFLPDTVEMIGTSAFQGCSDLETVVIGEKSKLNTIGWNAFKNDTKLDVSFAKDVATVVDNAFEGIPVKEEPAEEAVAETVEIEPETTTTEAVMAKNGWIKENGKWHYYKDNKSLTNFQKLSGKWYYFNSNGEMQTGFQKIGGYWYYFTPGDDGSMKTGFQKIGGYWYYFTPGDDGSMKTGFHKIGGYWYYFTPGDDGSMKTGFQKIGGCWYYFTPGDDGSMKTGFHKIGGYWYYFTPGNDGSMKTGFQKIGGCWYYFTPGDDGSMKTGWQKIGNYWYYFTPGDNGSMYTGWRYVNESSGDNGWQYFVPGDGGAWVGPTMTQDGVKYAHHTAQNTNTIYVVNYSGSASSLTIPEVIGGATVTEIGEGAFMGKTSLVSIDLPDTITVIRARAFKNCTNLANMN